MYIGSKAQAKLLIEGQQKKTHNILWPIIMAKKLLPTIGFLIQKKTMVEKMSLIVGHLCPEKNNIVGTHDRQ